MGTCFCRYCFHVRSVLVLQTILKRRHYLPILQLRKLRRKLTTRNRQGPLASPSYLKPNPRLLDIITLPPQDYPEDPLCAYHLGEMKNYERWILPSQTLNLMRSKDKERDVSEGGQGLDDNCPLCKLLMHATCSLREAFGHSS